MLYHLELASGQEARIDLSAEKGSYGAIAAHPAEEHWLAIGTVAP